MDGSNGTQVLSISYGAFSITLEGFGDPFPIMKRVTEYFREIATTDKSFGTLPIDEQHMEMGNFASTLRAEGTGVDMKDNKLRLSPDLRADGPMAWDQTASAIPSQEPASAKPAIAPDATAAQIAAQYAAENARANSAQKQAEADALASAIATAKNSVERDEEIKRRLDIIREQTLGVSEKYAQGYDNDAGHALLAQEGAIDDELVFIHPLRSRFKRLKTQNGAHEMTGTDGTRLQLSPEMRTIKVSR